MTISEDGNEASAIPSGLNGTRPAETLMEEVLQAPRVHLNDSRTSRKEIANGQTGIFFEYENPQFVFQNYPSTGNSVGEGLILGSSPTSSVHQDYEPKYDTPRDCTINGRLGVFYPDLSQQIGEALNTLVLSSQDRTQEPLEKNDGLATQLDNVHHGTCSGDTDRASAPNSIAELVNDNGGASNHKGCTTPQTRIQLDTPKHDLGTPSWRTWASTCQIAPEFLYGKRHAAVESDESDTVSEAGSGSSTPGIDLHHPRAVREKLVWARKQIDLVFQRWNGNPMNHGIPRKQPVTISYRVTMPDTSVEESMSDYHLPTWKNVRLKMERKIHFDPAKDMLLVDDVGVTRPNYFDQAIEDRVTLMVNQGLGYPSPSPDVDCILKIGVIFVDLTKPNAFMTFVRDQNPYNGLGVQYARKSQKDLQLIPPWVGNFMDVCLDHDRTLLALVHGKPVNQVTNSMMTEMTHRTVPEKDLLFTPPKDWPTEGVTKEGLQSQLMEHFGFPKPDSDDEGSTAWRSKGKGPLNVMSVNGLLIPGANYISLLRALHGAGPCDD